MSFQGLPPQATSLFQPQFHAHWLDTKGALGREYGVTARKVSNTEYNAMINPPPERGHYAQCEKYPMHCPNSCSKEVILRQDMPSHRQQCPLEPVECPFREAGCEVKLVRKELEGHVTNSITKHLTGLLEAFMETRKELMETKIALAETQARLPPQKK